MAAQPEFTESFNVEGATPELYIQFIERLRDLLEDGLTHNNVRQLCPQPRGNTTPTRFFDIVFSTTVRSVTVRFRRDNLYVVGFMQIQGSQWWEYGRNPSRGQPEPTHLIQGSRLLGFTMTYNPESLLRFFISHQELVAVVNDLGVTTDGRVREHGMTMIALTISEAIRLNRVISHISLMFDEGAQGGVIEQWMVDLVHGWSPVSRAIIVANRDGTDFALPQPNRMNVVTFANATREIGMVLRVCLNRNALVGGISCCTDLNDGDICPAGRPLVEVFQMAINDIHGTSPANFYGTIRASDGLTSEYLYNVDKGDAQYIRRLQIIILTGPSRPMLALGNFTIDISLMNKDTNLPVNGQITWDASNNITNVYDKPIYDSVDCGSCKLGINYAIFRDAVQATIEVKLMEGDAFAAIYGTIGARSGTFEDESLLFERDSMNRQRVELFNEIPLWRSVVAVPLAETLIIRADLWDHNYFFDDEQVAEGKSIFQAKLAGTFEQTITGQKGKIQVRVTWS